jgi:hypothetical protein
MADYRKDADRCYDLAKQMAKTEDLHAFLEMAQTWEKLANLHELSQRSHHPAYYLRSLPYVRNNLQGWRRKQKTQAAA